MEIKILTKSRVDLVDITSKLKPTIKNGILLAYTPHTTTGLFINENEPNLLKDIKKMLEKLVPQGGWAHDYQEGNADAHLRGILLGSSVVVPVSSSKLNLGTWQSIFFAELDGPRERNIIVKEIEA